MSDNAAIAIGSIAVCGRLIDKVAPKETRRYSQISVLDQVGIFVLT